MVAIPTYNESGNIRDIVRVIFDQGLPLDILIIDDNSPDGTGEIADEISSSDSRVHVIHRKSKSGLGTAYLEAFKYALDHEYEYVFQMDADFSHDPRWLKDFLAASKENDLVVGSRYINGVSVVHWPMSRLLLSYFANIYARLVTGIPVKDATGGFKCFRRKVLEALNLDRVSSSGYSFQIEMNYYCWKKGFKIKEIPIIFVDRKIGDSKMSTGIVREALLLLWKLRITSIFRKP